ncbi:SDR family oxidoreductase [Streptomyces asiaticus]
MIGTDLTASDAGRGAIGQPAGADTRRTRCRAVDAPGRAGLDREHLLDRRIARPSRRRGVPGDEVGGTLAQQGARRRVGPDIRVNTVLPGLIDTPMAAGNGPEVNAGIVADTPLGRIGAPAEVVPATLFLLSDHASFLTGTELVVDGGLSA